jgi:hypothetical protein
MSPAVRRFIVGGKKELEEKIAKLEAMLKENKANPGPDYQFAAIFMIPSALLSALFAWLGSRGAQRRRGAVAG